MFPYSLGPRGAAKVGNGLGGPFSVTSGSSVTSYGSFDPVGRVWTSTETTGGTAYPFSYTYPLNNLTAVAQGTRPRSFAYDASNRLVEAVNPESGTIRYS